MALDDFEEYLKRHQKLVDADNAIVERRLAQMYKEAYQQAAGDLAKLYARIPEKMSLPEAQKYKRLETIMVSLESEYKKLTGKALAIAIDTSAQNYTEAFYGYHWAMDNATGINLSWGVLPVDAIRASVFSEYSGLSIIKTFKKNAIIEFAQIQSAITRGIAVGKAYKETAKDLAYAFDRGLWQALRVVRTEAGRNYTEGNLTAYQESIDMGIDVVKVWDATLDMRTRNAHGILDGEEPDGDGLFHSTAGGAGPGPGLMNNAADDINCRCRLNEIIRDLPPSMRRVRGEDIIPYQSYSTWASARGWSRQNGWPKVKLM